MRRLFNLCPPFMVVGKMTRYETSLNVFTHVLTEVPIEYLMLSLLILTSGHQILCVCVKIVLKYLVLVYLHSFTNWKQRHDQLDPYRSTDQTPFNSISKV